MRQNTTNPQPAYSSVATSVSSLYNEKSGANLFTLSIISLLLHALLVGLAALIIFILQFLGIKIPIFEPLALKEKDIEFVLVDTPPAPPRNKNTKNRSDRASRSGGVKVPNRPQAQPMRAAGNPSPKRKASPSPSRAVAQKPSPQKQPTRRPSPRPTQQAPRPQPRQTPSQVAHATPPTPRHTPTPEPPAPKMPVPKAPTHHAPVAPPSPVTPTIKTPAAPSSPSPKIAMGGPIVHTPGVGSGSASGGRSGVGPSQIPTGLSGGGGSPGHNGSGSPGSRAGGGGHGSYDQNGSPGGGGGRPGVDALPAPDYGAYMAELQRRIKRNWRPPSAQEDKRVVVGFNIGKDGRLLNIGIQKSSGYPEADQAALAAVKLSAPFKALPLGHRDNDLAIQFTFDYNVYKQHGSPSFSYH